jgi:hypothetical protein
MDFQNNISRLYPQVSYFKELILWCVDKFNNKKRIIQLQGKSPISLAPTIFRRIIRLPEYLKVYKQMHF